MLNKFGGSRREAYFFLPKNKPAPPPIVPIIAPIINPVIKSISNNKEIKTPRPTPDETPIAVELFFSITQIYSLLGGAKLTEQRFLSIIK